MTNIKNKAGCWGCEACINICPKSCITMKIDIEGFEYPHVAKSKYINCGLCNQGCPITNTIKSEHKDIKAYGCKNKDELSRKTSSSGGVFILLCEEV